MSESNEIEKDDSKQADALEKAKTLALWRDYKVNPTEQKKMFLANKYSPLVGKIVVGFYHKRPAVLDYDDLYQAGMMGLLDAIDRYDPENEKKAQFQTYATFRVRGAVIDQINSMDWTPRSVRQNIKSVIKAIEQHYRNSQEEPSHEEIAENVGMSTELTKEVLAQMEKTYIHSTENEIIDVIGPPTNMDYEDEMSRTLSMAVNDLNDVERHFIYYKYYMGYSNSEIMEHLGVKTSELKNIRESAIRNLKDDLDEDAHGDNVKPVTKMVQQQKVNEKKNNHNNNIQKKSLYTYLEDVEE